MLKLQSKRPVHGHMRVRVTPLVLPSLRWPCVPHLMLEFTRELLPRRSSTVVGRPLRKVALPVRGLASGAGCLRPLKP